MKSIFNGINEYFVSAFNSAIPQGFSSAVVNFIEEGFQINIDDMLKPFVDVSLCFQYCLHHVSVWTETKTGIRKLKPEPGIDYLQNRLLKQLVGYGGNTMTLRSKEGLTVMLKGELFF
ncbi:hypothetical protein SAMN05444280_103197 [Tangfeifania diversioriginum]|uniref:Uncharacterized protein n=1 Tax=Tangfeifania diversioriginum TaxID=1168035 RepID=A0A1M6CBB8_9BACT|nr:hypothetical protein [Tangfeifania diversioriginum]SHI58084.1 hypothetical protein SAMN05444280_103197 [Tangfeifania diversioriginum]